MINIRLAEAKDIIHLKNLIDENISINYFTEENLAEIINKENHYIFVSTDETDEPQAMIYCLIDTLENACKTAFIPADFKPLSQYDKNTKVCLYKTTCTDKNARSSGILTKFMSKMDETTADLDFAFNIVVALIRPDDTIPVHNILLRNNFIKSERIISPWKMIKSYCGYCKNEYCTCDGMLYIKER